VLRACKCIDLGLGPFYILPCSLTKSIHTNASPRSGKSSEFDAFPVMVVDWASSVSLVGCSILIPPAQTK